MMSRRKNLQTIATSNGVKEIELEEDRPIQAGNGRLTREQEVIVRTLIPVLGLLEVVSFYVLWLRVSTN
jgi:hypothetical protein